MMGKKLISVILAAVMCILAAVPAFADTTTYTMIESVSITLKYDDFKAGSSDDDSNVTITLDNANGLYQVDSTTMSVPSNGWSAGDIPNLHIILSVNNEDTTKFAYSASRPSGVSVSGGEVHYGELRSQARKVYYEVYLSEVQESEDEQWEDEKQWNTDSSSGGPGAQGAWLKDPNNGRYWWSSSDGTRPYNSWLKINGVWYFFDQTGYRVENQWIQWKNAWYYLGQNGRMYNSELTPDRYWVNSDGAWDGKPKR